MLDIIGNICSIIGLILTIATFIYAFLIEKKLKKFEKNTLFNSRVPGLLNILKDQVSNLSRELSTSSERSIKAAINHCNTTIIEINTKLPENLSRQGIFISKRISKQYKSSMLLANEKKHFWSFIRNEINIDELWETYDILNSFIIRIDSYKKDKKVVR